MKKVLTDKQISDILKDITVIVDTREQKNDHILDFFCEESIPYKKEKLDTADYSFILPNYPEIGMDKKVLIEKKNSLTEIAGNFTSGRERFQREFERVTDEQIHLIVEDATWKKVKNGSYRSQLPSKAMMASLLTWNIRYNCPVWFVGRDESPELIYKLMYYELFEELKRRNR